MAWQTGDRAIWSESGDKVTVLNPPTHPNGLVRVLTENGRDLMVPREQLTSAGAEEVSAGSQPYDEFLDALDELIGRNRPCPICQNTEWVTYDAAIAVLVGTFPSQGDLDVGSSHQAVLICTKCRFLRSHLLPREGDAVTRHLGDLDNKPFPWEADSGDSD